MRQVRRHRANDGFTMQNVLYLEAKTLQPPPPTHGPACLAVALERFKKCYSRSERGFLGLGEALAKEQVA